jgi:site-specific recombinase
MEELLKPILADADGADIGPLIHLVDAIRPRRPEDSETAVRALSALALHLRSFPAQANAFRTYLLNLLATRRHVHLYTDTGVLANEGFFTTLRKRIAHRFLPEEVRDDYLKDVFGLVFHRPTDYRWVALVPDATWGELLDALGFDSGGDHDAYGRILRELLEALLVLSYRVAAVGLEPELVRNYPEIEHFESPFLAQNAEIRQYYERYIGCLAGSGEYEAFDDRHIRVLLEQCDEVLEKIRRLARQNGASISLTYHLQRATQMIARMHALLDIADPAHAALRRTAALELMRELVREENGKYGIVSVVRRVTDLLALQVTENASRTGEHYAASTRTEYFAMLRSAGGAGFIVGFMALVKILMGKLTLAPIMQAVCNSMNYSLGFVLVHLMHFTIATKQPAMTAATIAATMEQSTEKKRTSLEGVVELIAVVLRTQFLAIIGNVMVALPVSFTIALALTYGFGASPLSPEKALHLLHDIDPFHSLALFYAAIAGVCLFLAGLISGYYDNKCAYNRIPQRIVQLRWLGMILGERLRARFAAYIGNNLGALAGNFFFGIMLGSMATLGWILGLPIDIRHVTFSAAYLSYATVALGFEVPLTTVLISCAGIALIGLVNLTVSFSLALYVAMKSRGVYFSRFGELLGLLVRRFVANPRDFFLPPREPMEPPPSPPGVPGAAG